MAEGFSNAYRSLVENGGHPSPDSYLVIALGGGLNNWFVGHDDQDNPCILIQSASGYDHQPPSVTLENLDVQFHIPCKVESREKSVSHATCSVLKLKSRDDAVREIFFSVCDAIATVLGNAPNDKDLSNAMRRLAEIFRKILAPPSRTLAGLFGELVLIHSAIIPHELVRDWRQADDDRYDFSSNDLKVEVKSTSSRRRKHEFSYEQCSPPKGALGLVASIFVERASRGTSIHGIQQQIERRLTGRPDAVLKLREIVIETLGVAQRQAHEISFDLTLAMESIAYFDLNEVPAIRDVVPPNVSSVRFVSDLTESKELSVRKLADSHPFMAAYLEKQIRRDR